MFIYVSVCVCVHVGTSVQGVQEKTSDLLQLELTVNCESHNKCAGNSDSLHEQQKF